MKLLDNKTALITGASRGIGKSIAKFFHKMALTLPLLTTALQS